MAVSTFHLTIPCGGSISANTFAIETNYSKFTKTMVKSVIRQNGGKTMENTFLNVSKAD
jgi:hypothetical protein